ncbi:MAG: T9SS type A sorting domain-containing protein [Chitinophagales bacterium]|nr:T9SS type A sorting domain-containing protein [Chitinophagales bacterium]
MKQFTFFRLTALSLLMTLLLLRAQAQCTIAVNAFTNLSLPASCSYTLLPADLLASGWSCPGGVLVAEIQQGGVWVPANINASHIGQTLNARVRDQISGNFAWCQVKVEDKLPPVLSACTDLYYYCEDNCTAIPNPTISDCSAITINTTDNVFSYPCTSVYSRKVVRQYTVSDAWGNVATCTRSIYYYKRSLSSIVFPPSVTLQVSGTDCTPWCENTSARPAPTTTVSGFNTGSPTIDGSPIFQGVKSPTTCNTVCAADACALNVSYSDVVVPLCNTNRRVDRTWTVSSACSGTVTYLQRIWIFTDGNTSCGWACKRPTGQTQTYNAATGQTTFSWAVPTNTCIVRYDLEYRVKIAGVWQPWVSVSPGTNSYTTSIATGNSVEWRVRTRCNGSVVSTWTSVAFFIAGSLVGDESGAETVNRAEEDVDAFQSEVAAETLVFPNPSEGMIMVQLPRAAAGELALQVSDMQGRNVYNSALPQGTVSFELDLANQPKGLYLLQLLHENGEKVVKTLVLQ